MATKKAVSDTVVVALNYPHPMSFDLAGGRRVRINGNAENLRGKEQGHIPVGAFGLTQIKSADWEEIQAKYGKMRIFRNGLCFAANTKAAAQAEAEDKAETRHGREPVATSTARTTAASAE